MRLLKSEVKVIKEISSVIYGSNSKVILFGSRVNDTIKGGDIDLYIIPGRKFTRSELRDQRIKYLVSLKSKIGDQKIDLVVSTDKNSLIEKEAINKGIEL